jgi:RNA polymerase sigma-70 factor (ECF subfamily)
MKIEDVWSQYRSGINAFLHSKISDSDEVEDLLQEILIKTYINLPSVKSEESVKSWLFKIANHAIIDFYRKRAKRQSLSVDDLWYDENNHAAQQELSGCIEPFIKALPKETSQLLTEIDLKGRSQKDYAEALGISYSTLKSRVQSGRRQLRGLFEDCCHLSLDQHGVIIDFDPKSGNCENC